MHGWCAVFLSQYQKRICYKFDSKNYHIHIFIYYKRDIQIHECYNTYIQNLLLSLYWVSIRFPQLCIHFILVLNILFWIDRYFKFLVKALQMLMILKKYFIRDMVGTQHSVFLHCITLHIYFRNFAIYNLTNHHELNRRILLTLVTIQLRILPQTSVSPVSIDILYGN